VPDGYRPRSHPVHNRVPRYLGPGTSTQWRCCPSCLSDVSGALC